MKEEEVRQDRLIFVDNLRWVMIVLVVMMHINVTYGNVGSWYYVEKADIDLISSIIFGVYGSFVQAFFMGFLFFIAGYFVPGSFDRKGARRFITDRFIRLGIPTLIYMLLINPIIFLVMHYYHLITLPLGINLPQLYLGYIIRLQFMGESGPLWFALALLVFSLIYAYFRTVTPSLSFIPNPDVKEDKSKFRMQSIYIIIIILLIAAVSFLIRINEPIGSAVLNMQHPFFTQYVILFILGIYAYRNNLLQTIPYSFGIRWFKAALCIGIPFWVIIMVLGGGLEGKTYLFMGGLHWQALAYALWEAFFCLGVCLGLIVIFRKKYNQHHSLTRFLSDNAFGVYVFHAPLLVTISLLFKGLILPPVIKGIFIGVLTIPICFVFSWGIRRVQIFRQIFS